FRGIEIRKREVLAAFTGNTQVATTASKAGDVDAVAQVVPLVPALVLLCDLCVDVVPHAKDCGGQLPADSFGQWTGCWSGAHSCRGSFHRWSPGSSRTPDSRERQPEHCCTQRQGA